MKTLTAVLAILILAGIAIAAEQKAIYKLTRLSPTEVGIYCTNGGDPTGKKIGNTLIISCGN